MMHYLGDKCPPDGHAELLLVWLRGEISDEAYFELFDREDVNEPAET